MYTLDEICAEYKNPKDVHGNVIHNLAAYTTTSLRKAGILTPENSPSLRFINDELNVMFDVPSGKVFKVNEEGKKFIKTYIEKEILKYEN